MKGILFRPGKVKFISQLEENELVVTRRLSGLKEINKEPGRWIEAKPYQDIWFINDGIRTTEIIKPLYRLGEVGYVREAWATEKRYDHLKPKDIPKTAKIFYVNDGVGEWPLHIPVGKCRSPLFMPAWAARYFLRITDVRAERLRLPLSPEELALEGGEQALEILRGLDGKWCWRIEFQSREVKGEDENRVDKL